MLTRSSEGGGGVEERSSAGVVATLCLPVRQPSEHHQRALLFPIAAPDRASGRIPSRKAVLPFHSHRHWVCYGFAARPPRPEAKRLDGLVDGEKENKKRVTLGSEGSWLRTRSAAAANARGAPAGGIAVLESRLRRLDCRSPNAF